MRKTYTILGLVAIVLLVSPAINFADEFPTAVPTVTGQSDGKAPVVKLDGDWKVVYAEMAGKIADNKNFANIKIKNNVVTCKHEGKEKTFRLEFGPHHMIRCTMQEGERTITQPTEQRVPPTHHGVYIASQEYFCLSLNKGPDRRFGNREDAKERLALPRAPESWEGHQPHGCDLVIILQRAGTVLAESK